MKYLVTNCEISTDVFNKNPFQLSVFFKGKYKFFTNQLNESLLHEKYVGLNEGYIRDLDIKGGIHDHLESSYKNICSQWPLGANITGTFSSVLFDRLKEQLILCTDLIGLYPVYYHCVDGKVFVSNSIILIALITNNELDEIGILQRAISEQFSNIGSRTILTDCKRLLPGENIRFDVSGKLIEKKYDNSLYENLSSPSQPKEIYDDYWKAFKKEVELCLIEKDKVNVALSGGIDSRVILGAIDEQVKEIKCLTFGAKNNYETQLALRLAKLKDAKFESYYQLDLYFPEVNVLKNYTLQTEAVQICSWLEILENVESDLSTPLLLGELCEALPGRNIKKFSSRDFRQENFFKYHFLGKNYKFEKATPQNFLDWKEKTIQHFMVWFADFRLERMDITISKDKIEEGIKKDLEEIFDRIEAHNLPYSELYDELFSWYTFTRMRLSKQLLVSNSKFKACSPAMSLQILRKTSCIHPNLRLNYRFAKILFKNIPELKKFAKIPTSQSPLLPQNFPDVLRFPIWGMRSKIDSLLITRMMKTKRSDLRYRLFNSINWPQVYNLPNMEQNLKNYFSTNHLGEDFFKYLLDQATQRKNLEAWPFSNADIINASSLNLEIDLIKRYRGCNTIN